MTQEGGFSCVDSIASGVRNVSPIDPSLRSNVQGDVLHCKVVRSAVVSDTRLRERVRMNND